MRPRSFTRREFIRNGYAIEAANAGHADAAQRAELLVTIDDEIETRALTRIETAQLVGAATDRFTKLSTLPTDEIADLLERLKRLPHVRRSRD